MNIKKQGLKILSCGSGIESQDKQKRSKALPLGESMTSEAHPISFAVGGAVHNSMKKIFLILALSACAFFAHSQTVPNWVINFGMNKDTVFSAPVGRTYNNYVWSVQVIMTVHSGDTLTGTVEIVSSNDGVHWERYSSSMIKTISAMTHSGLVYWVDFADYTCPQSFLGIRYTKNLTHRGTMNAIVNYKKL